MSRSRRQKTAVPVVVVIIIAAIGYFVPLPPAVLDVLPPEIARLLPRPHPTADGEIDLNRLPQTPTSFEAAKDQLYGKVYVDRRETFYCNCPYTERRQVLLAECGLQPLAQAPRAERVEAEHVFPAHQFGNFRQCWREPETICGGDTRGRECCQQADPVFRAAHNDLYNLFPAVGEVNAKRSNYNWGMIEGEPRRFGRCDFEIAPDIRRAEPPEAVQGDIARTMLYMAETYQFRLSDQDRQLYSAWNNTDPPDDWERERSRRIQAIQGQGNRFIDDYTRLEP